MSGEERTRILAMLESGKITADQALTLIKAIEDDEESEARAETFETGPGAGSAGGTFPELERTAARARRLSHVPLIAGVLLTVLSAWGMYTVMQNSGTGFWFYCLGLPLMAGVAAIVFGAWSRTARWLFVRVQNPAGEGPRNISLGFPLPIGPAGWFLRTFGDRIEGFRRTNVDEVVKIFSATGKKHEPLIVNVDEGANGEQVQVYIG